jgi:hypothetical protein
MPANNVLEQIYRKQKIGRSVYSWAGDSETYAVSLGDHDARAQ